MKTGIIPNGYYRDQTGGAICLFLITNLRMNTPTKRVRNRATVDTSMPKFPAVSQTGPVIWGWIQLAKSVMPELGIPKMPSWKKFHPK